MKRISEYLEQAHHFECMAACETNPKNKRQLEKQAKDYHKLAEQPAANLGLTTPQTRPPHCARLDQGEQADLFEDEAPN